MANQKTIAIIGAGQAGAQAAQSLRQAGYDGHLYLIGDEPHGPYQRPPLSKKYLANQLAADRLALLPESFYVDNAVDRIFGRRVTALDAGAGRLTLDDGTLISSDQALITAGSRSRALPVPGANLDRVCSLRTIADVDRMKPGLRAGQRVIIIGGGYIGLEVAAIARALGLETTVVEAAGRVMERTTNVVVSEYFESLHKANGVVFAFGAAVEAITSDAGGELHVTTSAGKFAADWVLTAVGGQPNVQLAEAAGLHVDNGITVDDHCRTSAPNIFAAGDCANLPSVRYGRRIRLESVQNAIDQAKAAAHTMLGISQPYDPVPWFWSDQYDTKYQIAGLSQFADDHVVRGDPATGNFSVAHLRGGKLIALDAINQPRDYMMARRMVPTIAPVNRSTLADPDAPLTAAQS